MDVEGMCVVEDPSELLCTLGAIPLNHVPFEFELRSSKNWTKRIDQMNLVITSYVIF